MLQDIQHKSILTSGFQLTFGHNLAIIHIDRHANPQLVQICYYRFQQPVYYSNSRAVSKRHDIEDEIFWCSIRFLHSESEELLHRLLQFDMEKHILQVKHTHVRSPLPHGLRSFQILHVHLPLVHTLIDMTAYIQT